MMEYDTLEYKYTLKEINFKTQRGKIIQVKDTGKHNIWCDREELQQLIDRKYLLEKYVLPSLLYGTIIHLKRTWR